jgi:hypothetical protein
VNDFAVHKDSFFHNTTLELNHHQPCHRGISMSRQIRIVQTQLSESQPTVWISAATYKDSSPFSGVFAVASHDKLVRTNSSEQMVLDVICQMVSEQTQKNMLEMVLIDHPMNVLILDGPEDFATQIDWANKVQNSL